MSTNPEFYAVVTHHYDPVRMRRVRYFKTYERAAVVRLQIKHQHPDAVIWIETVTLED